MLAHAFGSRAGSLAAGIALVPEERRSQGVMLGASIQDNIALANISAVSRAGLVSRRRISDIAQRGMADLQIKARSPRQHVGELSGGNQQKVVLAKMLARTAQGAAHGRAHARHRRRHEGGDLPPHPRNSPRPAPP